jgi:hypothetical protein
MSEQRARIRREAHTIDTMVKLYCQAHHATLISSGEARLCPSCTELRAYAHLRLSKCPYQETKPTCAKCPIHCYQPNYRDQIRAVMRYAGPRMIYRYPLLAVRHLLDGFSRPVRKRAGTSESTKRANRK